MTLPSSRQRPWIFPDQRAHMKIHPLPQPEERAERQEMLSGHDAWHQEQMEAAHARVRSALTDNHHKEAYYLANAAFAPLTSRDSVTTRLKVHKNPSSLRGGVFTSKEGQQYGTNRLKERVSELNVRASAAFGVEAAQAQPSGPPGRDPEIQKMELALTTTVDDIQSGDVTSFQTSARAFYSALLAEGWRLGSSKLADFKGIIFNIRRDAIDIIEGPAPNQMGNRPGADERTTTTLSTVQRRRAIQGGMAMLDRADRALDVLTKVANLSVPERKQALRNLEGPTTGLQAQQKEVGPQPSPNLYPLGDTPEKRYGPDDGPDGSPPPSPTPSDSGSEASSDSGSEGGPPPDTGTNAATQTTRPFRLHRTTQTPGTGANTEDFQVAINRVLADIEKADGPEKRARVTSDIVSWRGDGERSPMVSGLSDAERRRRVYWISANGGKPGAGAGRRRRRRGGAMTEAETEELTARLKDLLRLNAGKEAFVALREAFTGKIDKREFSRLVNGIIQLAYAKSDGVPKYEQEIMAFLSDEDVAAANTLAGLPGSAQDPKDMSITQQGLDDLMKFKEGNKKSGDPKGQGRRHRRRGGAGPAEASHYLAEMDRLMDGGGKKKNDFRNYE